MNNLNLHISNYLEFCRYQKRLSPKTLKAYRIDLKQFVNSITENDVTDITIDTLEKFVKTLHQIYKPRTVKRKIATLKAFFHYLMYKDILENNPLNKLYTRFREPVVLPKTIPLHILESFLATVYEQHRQSKTDYQKFVTLRDIAVIELLFATGMRISELCSLKTCNVDLEDRNILIFGKGSRERRIQIGNLKVIYALKQYANTHGITEYFFTNQKGHPISEQAVRRMINKYTALASISLHITPHMFRHTFATCLLEADVDIRYIQEMLGHSSISITEIYTHVASSKQKDILTNRHPRNSFCI